MLTHAGMASLLQEGHPLNTAMGPASQLKGKDTLQVVQTTGINMPQLWEERQGVDSTCWCREKGMTSQHGAGPVSNLGGTMAFPTFPADRTLLFNPLGKGLWARWAETGCVETTISHVILLSGLSPSCVSS